MLVRSLSAVVVCLLVDAGSVLWPTFDLIGARLGRPVGPPGIGLGGSLLPATQTLNYLSMVRET